MGENPKGQAALMAAALAAAAAAQDEAGLDLAQLQQFMLQQLSRSVPATAASSSPPCRAAAAAPASAAVETAASNSHAERATATEAAAKAGQPPPQQLPTPATAAAAPAEKAAPAAAEQSSSSQAPQHSAATADAQAEEKEAAAAKNETPHAFEAFKHRHLREVDASSAVVVDCADGASAAPVSASSWADLHLKEELLRGVEHQGFSKPSKIQAAALPLILTREENLIAQAQNGSGKTATFALAMLTKIDVGLHVPQALCLCPTRELAQQTVHVVEALARFMDTSVFVAIPQKADAPSSFTSSSSAENKGGAARGKCVVYTTLTSPAVSSPVVVGTPGKCMELLKKRKFPPQHVRLFVLDEADELINFTNNMAPQVQQIRRFFPPRLQILLFSATFSEEVRGFAEKLMPTANKISVKKEELTLTCIKQYYINCDTQAAAGKAVGPSSAAAVPSSPSPPSFPPSGGGGGRGGGVQDDVFSRKFAVLSSLYASLCLGQSVIFVNSRRTAFSLALKMQEEGYAVSLICGTQAQGPEKMGIEMRDRIMEEFRRGETKVLICTDVLARGIDVPQVTLVVNFDLPLVFQGRVFNSSSNSSMGGGGFFDAARRGERDFPQQQQQYQEQPPQQGGMMYCRREGGGEGGGGRLGGVEGTGPRVNMETYIHRIGRTGRFGLKGIAINLITSSEQELLQQIRDFYKCSIEPLEDDPEEIEEMIRKLRI